MACMAVLILCGVLLDMTESPYKTMLGRAALPKSGMGLPPLREAASLTLILALGGHRMILETPLEDMRRALIHRAALQEVGKDAECPFPDTFAAPPVETAWLFLKGLGREALETPEILRNVFTQWGAGDSTRILADPATQTRRGTAIVQMKGVDQVIP